MKKNARITSVLTLVAGLVTVLVFRNFGMIDVKVIFYSRAEGVNYIRIPDEVVPGIIECHRREVAGELDEGTTLKALFANVELSRWSTSVKRSSDLSFVLPRGLYAFSLHVKKEGHDPARDVRLVRVDRMWKSLDFTRRIYSLKVTPIY